MKSVTLMGLFAATAAAYSHHQARHQHPNFRNFKRQNTTAPATTKDAAASGAQLTTLTVKATVVSTVVSCAPTVTNCPAANQTSAISALPSGAVQTVLVTDVVVSTEIICPVSDADKLSKSVVSEIQATAPQATISTAAPTNPGGNGKGSGRPSSANVPVATSGAANSTTASASRAVSSAVVPVAATSARNATTPGVAAGLNTTVPIPTPVRNDGIPLVTSAANATRPIRTSGPFVNSTFSPTVTAPGAQLTTLIVKQTVVNTVISCAPTVTNCPAANQTAAISALPPGAVSTALVTEVVTIGTTICPVSDVPKASTSLIAEASRTRTDFGSRPPTTRRPVVTSIVTERVITVTSERLVTITLGGGQGGGQGGGVGGTPRVVVSTVPTTVQSTAKETLLSSVLPVGNGGEETTTLTNTLLGTRTVVVQKPQTTAPVTGGGSSNNGGSNNDGSSNNNGGSDNGGSNNGGSNNGGSNNGGLGGSGSNDQCTCVPATVTVTAAAQTVTVTAGVEAAATPVVVNNAAGGSKAATEPVATPAATAAAEEDDSCDAEDGEEGDEVVPTLVASTGVIPKPTALPTNNGTFARPNKSRPTQTRTRLF